MQVSVLGPFEVRRNGVVSTPSAPKLRRVLALLAVHSNTVVRTDRLIEELWEDRPPFSAMTTLQTYVYQLRKLHQMDSGAPAPGQGSDLGDGKPALHTTPNGYTLLLPPDALDSARFAQLAERGRATFAAGEVEPAARLLAEALQLWRGPALVDVGVGPVLQSAVVWLDELHNSVVEQRIDANLALGRHQELIGELTVLAADRPTHEGLQAKLIISLYRCGRRSEALQVYQRARETLAQELGLEPSPELQRLQQAVLSADPALDPPAVRPEEIRLAQPVEAPHQLPPDVPTLIGRSVELATARQVIDARDRSSPPVVVTFGAPGSGKSAFCVQLANQVRADYPDGQLYASLIGPDDLPADPADTLADFLLAVGVPQSRIPDTLADRARLFRSWTARRRVLVVLDDVMSPAQLLPLLPTGRDCTTIAAARRQISAASITVNLYLGPLHPADGIRMLTSTLGEKRVLEEPNAAAELVELCGGLPLALHRATSQLELRPHWSIRRLVRRTLEMTQLPPPAPPREVDLYASVRRTYRLLPAAAQAAFRAMGCADQPVGTEFAAVELGMDEAQAESVLEKLVEFQLADVTSDDVGEGNTFRYRLRSPFWALARLFEWPADRGRPADGQQAHVVTTALGA